MAGTNFEKELSVRRSPTYFGVRISANSCAMRLATLLLGDHHLAGASRVFEGSKLMAVPRAFVSFDYDNNLTQKNLFAGQAKKDSPTPFTVEDWSSKSPLPQAQWEALIGKKISATNMLIVLVGKSMSSAIGVAKEIVMAKAHTVPVFGVYVDGAGSSSTLPVGLQRNRTVAWSWPTVAACVEQMMGEGKNNK